MMIRQYRRNTYSRRKSSKHPKASLTWVWIFTGILIGVIGATATYSFFNQAPIKQNYAKSHPTPAHKPLTDKSKKEKASAERFEFYTLLPGMEIQIPDKNTSSNSNAKVHSTANANLNSHSSIANSTRSNPPAQKNIQAPSSALALKQSTPHSTLNENSANVATTTNANANSNTNKVNFNKNTSKHISEVSSSNTPLASPSLDHHAEATLKQNIKEKIRENPKENSKGNEALVSAQFIIQAGIFQGLDQAEALKAKLTLQGFNTRVQKVQTQEGHTWFRVTLGPFPSETLALKQKKRLEEQKIQGILILQRPNA